MILPVKDCSYIDGLFQGWEETLIWSCLQGHMGQAFADDRFQPESAGIVVADFCFLAGKPDEQLLLTCVEAEEREFLILVPQTQLWEGSIETTYKNRVEKVQRYATKKEGDIFDRNKLQKFADELKPPYSLCMMDESFYEQAIQASWSSDLCSQFYNWEDYKRRGIGVVAVLDGKIVAGASSYTVYAEGIEIEVDTKEEFRRKGLAQACCARLISECLKRGLYPSWDAHNKGSLALAEKLGYHFDRAYTAYCLSFG